MPKRIEIDGRFYRRRKGRLVEIPSEWVNRTLHPQTKRKRLSKSAVKDEVRHPLKSGSWPTLQYIRHRQKQERDNTK